MTVLETAIRKRTVAISSQDAYSLYSNGVAKVASPDFEEVSIKLELVQENYESFLAAQETIEEKCTVEELSAHLLERNKFIEGFAKTKAILKHVLAKKPAPAPVTPPPQPIVMESHTSQVQLPKINLPVFEGNYTDWTSFIDLYNALVNDKSNLTKVQKLQYLKSSVKGEPLRLIQSLATTEANYDDALTKLKLRYDNQRIIVLSHVKAIFMIAAMKNDSASSLRRVLDAMSEHLMALEVLKQPTALWSTLLVYILCEKLDTESRKQWELSLTTTDVPEYDNLVKFLEVRCRALEASSGLSNKPSSVSTSTSKQHSAQHTAHTGKSFAFVSSERPCVLCSSHHAIYQCSQFHQAATNERYNISKKHRLCLNCLNPGHRVEQCRAQSCKTCQKRHHTLLHMDSKPQATTGSGNNTARLNPDAQTFFSKESKFPVMLSTAIVKIKDQNGRLQVCRALVDSGSQANFITQDCVDRLGLPKSKYNASIQGIGSSTQAKPQGMVSLNFLSCVSNFNASIKAVILTKISDNIPSCLVEASNWTHLRQLEMADPEFDKPAAIDLLLGAEVFSLVLLGQKISSISGPSAFHTELGWIVTGRCSNQEITNSPSCYFVTLDQQLRQFWELEEVPNKTHFTKEEVACEKHFIDTHRREESGRYTVELPFKEDKQDLGDSKSRAVRQLYNMERQFQKNQKLREEYCDFMREYEDLGHMELVPANELANPDSYYIPHHAVIKASSTTTKLRVVYNASAETPTGASLNKNLMVGNPEQAELVKIIVRFRLHKIALVADIEKMYRQINIHKPHQNFHRIVWRASPQEPVKDYRLTTVTYGTSSAPFSAIRTLKQLACDERENFPLASTVLANDFYVDDLLSGANSVQEARALQVELDQILSSGGFHLRKWASNDLQALEFVSQGDKPNQKSLQWDDTETIKTLGVIWNPKSDCFSITVQPPSPSNKQTKRLILSEVAKLFDPLGWLAPVTLIGKVLIQQLWILGLDWDAEVPPNISETWLRFCNQLPSLQTIAISRYIHSSPGCHYELHGFSDASEQGYGAVVYLKSIHHSGEIFVSIIAAKTRVAPIRQIAIPRLELCGAVLLARLLNV